MLSVNYGIVVAGDMFTVAVKANAVVSRVGGGDVGVIASVDCCRSRR